MKSVDVLIAVRNEEKSIPIFIERFKKLALLGSRINLIFLEDGSTDKTVSVLKEISEDFDNVEYISLDNKYGQYAALCLGLQVSTADAVLTMDVDGGHPIETAIEMIKSFEKGSNLVQGQRIVYKRKKLYRSIASYAYNFFFYIAVGVNLFHQNVMFRLMDKKTKELFLRNKKWWHIFKTNFNSSDAIKTDYIKYEAPEREFGESKYGFFRLLKLSYKSFFALMSLKRLMFINLLLITFIIASIYYESILLMPIGIIGLFIINSSYYLIINHYPISLLKINETSIQGLKR